MFFFGGADVSVWSSRNLYNFNNILLKYSRYSYFILGKGNALRTYRSIPIQWETDVMLTPVVQYFYFQNYIVLGYFDPGHVFLDYENK